MAQFPKREAEILVLAQRIVAGLTEHAADFPAPPIPPAALQALINSFVTLSDQQVIAQAAAEQVTVTKAAGLEELVTAMRVILRYSEGAVNNDDAKLSAIGWGAKAAGTPFVLEIPGPPTALEAPRQILW